MFDMYAEYVDHFAEYSVALDEFLDKPHLTQQNFMGILYVALGLIGESGELANLVKKILRNRAGEVTPEAEERLKDELGDVLWYWTRMVELLGFTPEEVMDYNIDKLTARQKTGTIKEHD